ncbi:MAG TPA: FAD-dependent oxidoreductase [Ktedonobacterales bacterium]|jgi:3-phenylpropionate/trans-cinnamate dioxygenase ferredoxin reductase subunit|nr:FAD-dependent oxidoreductase [Ktedonobacterales bacterium]
MDANGMPKQVVVIVGAGLAGGNAAVTLREEGWQGRILLLGTEPSIPFGRPPLSKTYLRAEEDLSAWRVKPADWYGDHDVELRTGVTVRQVDTARKQLRLANGDIVDYDKLVLCTGARNRPLSAPGATLPGIFQLRTVAECDAIRQAARPGARAVVVGMGFIGAEVASSLRQLGLEVTTVLSGAAPLANVLGDEVAAVLATIHREHGVHLVTHDHVIGFEGDTWVERVLTAKGERLACDLVVAGIGVTPDVEALSDSGIALDNGILVDARCHTSLPDVFAAGDVANLLHPVFGRVRVEHFNNAEQQGRAVARAVLGTLSAYDYIYSFWSDQYEHKLEYVGFAEHWERIVLRGSPAGRRFLAFYLTQGILQAVCGLNRGGDPEIEADSELRACQALIRGRIRLAEAALADDSIDLWSLNTAP